MSNESDKAQTAKCSKCKGVIDPTTVSLFHQVTGKHDQFPSHCLDCMGKALMAMRPLEDRGDIRG